MNMFDLFCLLKTSEENDDNHTLQDEIDAYLYADNSIINELRKDGESNDF